MTVTAPGAPSPTPPPTRSTWPPPRRSGAVREVLADAGLLGDSDRFVLRRARGARTRRPSSPTPTATRVDRRVRVLLLDVSGRPRRDVVVSVTRRRRSSRTSSSTPPPTASCRSSTRVRDHRGDRPAADERWVRGAGRARPRRRRRSARCRCRPASRLPGGGRAAASCAGARLPPGPTRRTCPGRTRSTASSPTSTSSRRDGRPRCIDHDAAAGARRARATSTTPPSRRRRSAPP